MASLWTEILYPGTFLVEARSSKSLTMPFIILLYRPMFSNYKTINEVLKVFLALYRRPILIQH